MEIPVLKNIYGANQEKADEIRRHLSDKGVLMLNIIGSPGSGKTTLLERTIEKLKDKLNIVIIQGDIATDRDAVRIKQQGIPVVLINTDGACHLEALSIEKSFESFDLETTDLIFIENVGNMVCPAEFDIGEHAKIAVISTPEGDDKPGKYPLLFHEAKAVVLNKTDLLPHTSFNVGMFLQDVRKINGKSPVFKMSAFRNEDMGEWFNWLESMLVLQP